MAANALWLVFRREFRSYLLSPIATIVIAVFLVATGWLFFSPFFLNGRADLRDFFTLLPLLLSFVVPAITMRLFAEEYRGGTFEITRTHPISLLSVVAGKYAAAMALVAVMLLPTVSYAIFVSFLGELDWGPVIGGYVGALFLAAMLTAIGLLASSLTKNQIVAYIIGIALAFFFTTLDRMLLFLPGNLAGFFQVLGADFHFQNIARGVIDSRDLIYFVTMTALALYATALVLAPPRLRGRARATVGLELGAHAAFLLFITVVTLASGSLFARVDLTQNRIHSLSPVSRDTVVALQEPVTVRAFFSGNLPAPFNQIEQSLRDLLAAYAVSNPEQFNYAFYSMTKPEESLNLRSQDDLSENERLAQQYGVVPIQIQQVEQDEIKLLNAYMGVTIIYGDTARTLGAVTSTEQLEFDLTSTIRALTERGSALLSRTEPIAVDLYLSSSLYVLAPEFERLPDDIMQLVDELGREYYHQLEPALHDPFTDPAARERARALQLPSLGFGRDEAGTDGDAEAYATVVVDTGGQLVRLNLIRTGPQGTGLVDTETLEQEIRTDLDAILSPQLTLGYLVGNGTPPYRGFGTPRETPLVVPDLVDFYQLATREYEIDGFFARDGVPDGVQTAMVVGPRSEFSEFELFELDQFLMRGGSLILLLDAYDIRIEGNRSQYSERRTGIEQLIEHYGVRLTQGQLLDERSYVVNEIDPNGVAVQIPVYSAPEIGGDQLNSDFPFLRNIDKMVLLNVTPLELVAQLPDGVSAFPLITSSDDAWVLEGDLNLTPPTSAQPPPASQRGRYTIAYLLEGAFESYFADKPLPTPVPAGDEDAAAAAAAGQAPIDDRLAATYRDFLPRSSGGKLIVMGTSMTLHSSLIDAEGRSPVALFVLNTIDFMNGREGVAELRAKGASFRPLAQTSPFVRALTKVVNIAGLPLIVIVAGLTVWLLHRAGRRRIRRRFARSERG